MPEERIAVLGRRVLAGEELSREEGAELAGLPPEDLPYLFAWASRIRVRYCGLKVRCCSIIAAKVGGCGEDCAFCSQSAHFRTPTRGMTIVDSDRVLAASRSAAENGADSFCIVNSGYGPKDAEIERLAGTVGQIRREGRVRACASLGVLTEEQARRLAELGVQRYNHNLQTSRRFFPNIITTHSYDERLATMRAVKMAGLSLCSGALFGMGETWEDRIDLALELRRLGVDVVPINFLHPIPGTPLQHAVPLPPMTCLHVIAVYRFLLPRSEIKIAGGREVNLRDLQSWIFLAGANSFLIGNYLTTCGRAPGQDLQMVRDLGLELDGPHAPPEPTVAAHA